MNILLVDDQENLRRVTAGYLRSLGHRVLDTFTAEDALPLVEESDAIVTDVDMPGMGGIEFVRRVRGDAGSTQLPVIVTSGALDLDMERQARQAGASACLQKPFSLGALAVLLARLQG